MRRVGELIVLITLLTLIPKELSAQKFLWNVGFRSAFDNREYDNIRSSESGTLFGVSASPVVGIGFGEGHSIMAGGELTRHFGELSPKYHADVLLYYHYNNDFFKAYAGVFPAMARVGEYPLAFKGDDMFFEAPIQGALFSLSGKKYVAELACNWTGKIGTDQREKFQIWIYARRSIGFVYGALPFMMHHYACSYQAGNVVDNIWIYPHLGFSFEKLLPVVDKMDLKLGWLQSFQNDRIMNEGYKNPGGFQMEFDFRIIGIGISETFYKGSPMMPFYNRTGPDGIPYANDLYFGNLFYNSDAGIYNRIEIYYEPQIRIKSLSDNHITFRISSVHHYDGSGWGWQQKLTLKIALN